MHARGPATAGSILRREETNGQTRKKRRNRLFRRFRRNGSVLEGERDAAAHHAEVIVRPIHHVPTEIVHPADVRGDANFDAAAKLADPFRRGTQMVGRGRGKTTRCSLVKVFSLTAAEDRTASRPNIWRKARTVDR